MGLRSVESEAIVLTLSRSLGWIKHQAHAVVQRCQRRFLKYVSLRLSLTLLNTYSGSFPAHSKFDRRRCKWVLRWMNVTTTFYYESSLTRWFISWWPFALCLQNPPPEEISSHARPRLAICTRNLISWSILLSTWSIVLLCGCMYFSLLLSDSR